MKRLAVFVEGYTELLFVDTLIRAIAGSRNVAIQHSRIRGGGRAPRHIQTIQAANQQSAQVYFVMIFDCGGDDSVKTRIDEEHENLTRARYTKIIGLRDIRPKFSHADIPRLEMGLRTRIKTSLIPVQFILSVMEIEAWFLAEHTHFPRIDPALTTDAIKQTLGFDPRQDDMSLRLVPAEDLDACYRLVGGTYKKANSATTINALDCAFIYLELKYKIAYLQTLCDSIDEFLA